MIHFGFFLNSLSLGERARVRAETKHHPHLYPLPPRRARKSLLIDRCGL
jgi:hypothetical protein